MKTIEEKIHAIQNLDDAALEQLADDAGVVVPTGLGDRIRENLAAAALAETAGAVKTVSPQRRMFRRILAASLSAAAVLAGLVLLLQRPAGPEDTFDDPALAYASLQQTFEYISEKVRFGAGMAEEALPLGERPFEILKNINEK